MAERIISLTLDRVQRGQLFAHLQVYLFHLGLHPGDARYKTRGEIILAVACRLKDACRDEREQVVFPVSSQESQAIKEALRMLKAVYEQEPAGQTTTSAFALDHLATCSQFIEKAEQQAIEETGKVM